MVKIQYKLGIENPSSSYFDVELKYSNLPLQQKKLDLIMPVWRPGRYLVFDFASGVQDFKALSNGKTLKWEKTDKKTWQVSTEGNSEVIIKYKVFGNEFATRTRGLDSTHAFVNGTSVFMYSEKFRKNPITLEIIPYKKWYITTGLERFKDKENVFFAPDYDYFVDCPIEIGNQTDFDFEVEGVKHTISFIGEANYDKKKLIEDFTKIIKKNYEFWGSVPYKRYVFIIHCSPTSGGGTEHINSTIVGVKPAQFASKAGYEAFLRLISHEFFHTWNVKQLKPKGLTPFDFTKENYTSELWIAEGGTSYYDGLLLTRTKQMNVGEFYKEIAKAVEEEINRPGNRVQSVAESSYDAWIKFWRRTPNSYISESDYYMKGSYVNMILDLEIRHLSRNKHSLDDIYKAMFYRFPLDIKGYTNADFKKMCEKYSGKNLDKFFDAFVFGVEPIDWEKYLGYAGLSVSFHDNVIVPVLGIRPVQKSGKIVINEVLKNTAADEAGLVTGDEIIALNGMRMSYAEMEKLIRELKSGDAVKMSLFRNNKLLEVNLKLRDSKITNYIIEKIQNPTKLQKEIYESWLETQW